MFINNLFKEKIHIHVAYACRRRTYLRSKWRAKELRFNGTCEKLQPQKSYWTDDEKKRSTRCEGISYLLLGSNNFIFFDRKGNRHIITCQANRHSLKFNNGIVNIKETLAGLLFFLQIAQIFNTLTHFRIVQHCDTLLIIFRFSNERGRRY
jgi:hypothetical protein